MWYTYRVINENKNRMNKKMDVNFAFAILLLVAAIAGMYFWIDNASEEVGDLYNDQKNMVIERNVKAEEFSENGLEDLSGDAANTVSEDNTDILDK
jgi:uncharacterized protein (UPF0333 family)